ncbi:hypothetical protein LTR10_020323 [Elasticomyces elasticus]|uniref:Major facilitator superfamily (MFS) profile domain-containing protein n=1 Tax=Exophiala sideris TaxID=1016849 RepID=A0ABR0J7N2_9EURO|nr:hypothetical protein LTR10_020323 [Elasticomyces elasticus]KAK5029980.1 hypothetical protein LTS07_005704 [Exophiala sideris]KAK5058258.1 hypothetical protein LTR69_006662 [Exophiala sideris]
MSTATETHLHTVLQSEDHEVQPIPAEGTASVNPNPQEASTSSLPSKGNAEPDTEADPDPTNVANVAPDGGYGWVVVTSCAIITFWFNGIMASWGVIQAALLRSNLRTTSTSTISFVGTLGLAATVSLGLFGVRLMRLLGGRNTALLGVLFLSLSQILSSFTVGNVGGLFGTSGILMGLGSCLCYSLSNTIPTQYFTSKLGLASGLVKFGGGVGAAVLSVALNSMIERVGVAWTFRILGFMILATGGPAAWFLRERVPIGASAFLDLSMFKNLPFTAVFCAGAIGTFALFVPPYFLPLVAQTIGLSSTTGASLVAGFNGCTAIGRLLSGWGSDFVGPLNMFLCTLVLNAVSMLAIWPFSDSLAPLIVFAMLNGLANGAFFTLYPVVVTSTASKIDSRTNSPAVAMGMAITGWTGGYLLGAPIAGYLLQAEGVGIGAFSSGDSQPGKGIPTSIDPFRPAIFYAGGVTLAAAGFVLVARMRLGEGLKKKV